MSEEAVKDGSTQSSIIQAETVHQVVLKLLEGFTVTTEPGVNLEVWLHEKLPQIYPDPMKKE